MRKSILFCTAIFGLAVPLAAEAAAPNRAAPAQPMQMTVIAAAPALAVRQLQSEVRSIQTQVQALQAQQQAAAAYTLAELQNLPTG